MNRTLDEIAKDHSNPLVEKSLTQGEYPVTAANRVMLTLLHEECSHAYTPNELRDLADWMDASSFSTVNATIIALASPPKNKL